MGRLLSHRRRINAIRGFSEKPALAFEMGNGTGILLIYNALLPARMPGTTISIHSSGAGF
jgi:hypothetical protein